MRDTARVVVIGGGCVGMSVLYGLVKRGVEDCILIERSRLAGASTRLAGGFIPTYVRSDAASRLINRSIDIYKGVEAETGLSVGWHNCGQMRLARSRDRYDEYLSYMNVAEAIGADARLLTAKEALELWPLIASTDGILGALYHPGDGYVGPTDVTMALAKGARDRGATIYEQTKALAIDRSPSGEWVVRTSAGMVRTEHIVLATGNYARQTGRMLGLDVPTVPVVVQYWFTDTIPEIAERRRAGLPEMPITRDDYFLGYMREEGDGMMFGSYERPERLQLFGVDGIPDSFDGDPLPADFEAHEWAFERGAEIMPALGRAGIKDNIRGPMQMTADGMPLCGPAFGLRNVWLAEGVPGGILWGGTLGEQLASWIVEGEPTVDMSELDPLRFGDYATKEWICLKAVEIWGAHSDVVLPGTEFPAGRPGKTTPCHDRLAALGAVFGAVNGWESPNWYAPEGVEPADRLSYRNPAGRRHVEEEARAVREAAGLVEMSEAAKFEVSGLGAAAYLAKVLCTRLPDVGQVAGAYQLHANGGVRATYSVVRLAMDRFYLVAPARMERLCEDELCRLLPDAGVTLTNVTMAFGVLAVSGPKAADILSGLLPWPVADLAWGRCATGEVGLAAGVRLLRTSGRGENGYELHHPVAWHRSILEALLKAGRPHGLRMVGRCALDPLRLEKSYAAVGPDMNFGISALEAGLEASIDWDNPDFIGRTALLAERDRPPGRRLATLAIMTEDASVLGLEGVYKEGRLVGRVTSGTRSFHFGHDIALALLPPDLCVPGTELSVPVLEAMRPARVLAPSPYDPENRRLAS